MLAKYNIYKCLFTLTDNVARLAVFLTNWAGVLLKLSWFFFSQSGNDADKYTLRLDELCKLIQAIYSTY